MFKYCTVADVTNYAKENGYDLDWDQLEIREKNELVAQSTIDIETFTKIPRMDQIPFAHGEQDMVDASVLQVINLMNTNDFKKLRDRAASVTSGSFSDTLINIANTQGTDLSEIVKTLVNDLMSKLGLNKVVSYGRG